MSVQETIRKLDIQGVSGREIARRIGVSRDTVSKYLRIQDYSPQAPVRARRPSASGLSEFESFIEEWLDDDESAPRKQRHTAQRIFDRLVDEHGYDGTYSPVQRFVKRYKQARQTAADGHLELVWPPGTMQVDFGEAEAIIGGKRETLHVLVLTFPFSNMRFAQAYRGETAECVTHGLRTVFEHVGFVAPLMVFDNATGVGRRRLEKVVETKLFSAFKAHYRSSARYCNPEKGNEKGNVENAVGFLRRNFMVPVPAAASIQGLNKVLMDKCDRLGAVKHWRKQESHQALFVQDQAAGLALPSVGFDSVRYESRKADKYGHLLVENNTYAAGPVFAGRRLTVGIRHDVIEILDEHAAPIRVFDRVFGYHPETIMDPASVLGLLAQRPGAWANSTVRALVVDPVRDWMDSAGVQDRARLLSALDAASEATSFDTAVQAATQIIELGDDPGRAAVSMLARRLAEGTDPQPGVADLEVYDRLFAVPTGQQAAPEPAQDHGPGQERFGDPDGPKQRRKDVA